MRIEPKAAMPLASSQMDFPHALERYLVYIVGERLSGISFVRPDVMQVEQDAAIGLVGNERHKLAIRQILGPRSQVIHSRLNGERDRQANRQCANRSNRRF